MNNLGIKSLFICKHRETTGVLITVSCSLGKAESKKLREMFSIEQLPTRLVGCIITIPVWMLYGNACVHFFFLFSFFFYFLPRFCPGHISGTITRRDSKLSVLLGPAV